MGGDLHCSNLWWFNLHVGLCPFSSFHIISPEFSKSLLFFEDILVSDMDRVTEFTKRDLTSRSKSKGNHRLFPVSQCKSRNSKGILVML